MHRYGISTAQIFREKYRQLEWITRLENMLLGFRLQKVGEGGKIVEDPPGVFKWQEGTARMPTHREAVEQMNSIADNHSMVTYLVNELRASVAKYGLLINDQKFFLARQYMYHRNW